MAVQRTGVVGGGGVCLSNSIVVRSGVLVDQGFLIINIVIRREGRSGTVGGGWNWYSTRRVGEYITGVVGPDIDKNSL